VTAPSLHAVVDDPGERTVEGLLEAHAAQLAGVTDAVGIEAAAEAAGLQPDTVAAVAGGDIDAAGDLDLGAVASILALGDGAPPAGDLVNAALDELLFGMTAGVLDVDVVAGELTNDLEPREVQGMLEGRHPLTLREYAALQQVIEGRSP
jgi:hypothetical protein